MEYFKYKDHHHGHPFDMRSSSSSSSSTSLADAILLSIVPPPFLTSFKVVSLVVLAAVRLRLAMRNLTLLNALPIMKKSSTILDVTMDYYYIHPSPSASPSTPPLKSHKDKHLHSPHYAYASQHFSTELPEMLASLMEARDPEALQHKFGGLHTLSSQLHTDISTGLLLSYPPPPPNNNTNSSTTTNNGDTPHDVPVDVFHDHDLHLISERKQVFGENAYPRKKPKSLWSCIWEAFNDMTLLILIVCAALSLGFGIKSDGLKQGWYDGGSIAIAVVLVVFVTALSNYKQSRSFQRLTAVERDNVQVQVIRNAHPMSVPILDVVVGDVVRLRTGDVVPADGLLIETESLAIDESSFTGETEYLLPDPSLNPFIRSGSKVQDGHGYILITRVGPNTQWGRMMLSLANDNSTSKQTPLQVRLVDVANLVGKVGLSVALMVLVILVIFYFTGRSSTDGDPKFQAGETSPTQAMNALVHIFSIAVTIVVVAVPEGLPLAVTLTLAYSMRKMMQDNALVRRLAACETMGSATTICTDKTGTLTTNQMTVVEAWFAGTSYVSKKTVDVGRLIMECLKDDSSQTSQLRFLMYQGIALNTTGTIFMGSESSCAPQVVDGHVASDNVAVGKSSLRRDIDWDESNYSNVEVSGSPTEQAILWWGIKIGMMKYGDVKEENTILQVETFNSKKKRAGVVVRSKDGRVFVHWKGAAEIILSMCDKFVELASGGGGTTETTMEQPMSVEKRQEIRKAIEDMANSSLRCVAFAYCEVTGGEDQYREQGDTWVLPQEALTLMAVVGMKDPCRPGVKKAVETVKDAGVVVRMVTGDNIGTAKAIARECGILEVSAMDNNTSSVEGWAFRAWTENERVERVPKLRVLARATPEDKLLFVKTLQSLGEVVAVTGDGTNDALALHEANIGLSMGIQGTEVAKESSDIIILDDDFASIVKVVRWGRAVYFNIQKFLQFQLTVNVAALVINFVAAVTSGDVPLTAVQLLWVNLIMDTLGALALATEKPTNELMKRTPVAPNEPLITKKMWWNLAFQAVYQITILLTLQFHGVKILRLAGSPDAELINRTIIFNAFVLCQLFNEVNARQPYRRNIFHGLLESRLFIGILVSTIILQVVMVEFLENFASTIRLDWQHWLICIILASFSWPIALLAKFIPIPNIPTSNFFKVMRH